MNLTSLFDLSFQGRRGKPALEFQNREYTFGDLDLRSNRMAHFLIARGLTAGDRLCVYLTNGIDMIDLFLACVKTGVIFVPVNILYKEREILHILTDADPRAVVAEDHHFPGNVPVWHPKDLEAAQEMEAGRPGIFPDGDAPVALIYTSGTTGASKGAILTHNNFAANGLNLLTCWNITESDRFLLSLPLFHIHGLGNGLHVWLIGGCLMRLQERFEYNATIKHFLDFHPTLFFGVPTMYVRLLKTPPNVAREISGFMRLFVCGSAPLPASVLEEFQQLFGQVILERYGMTETFMTISNPYAGERRAGTVGLPLPGISFKLLDGEGNSVPDGQAGELFVSGPTVLKGYWRREDATREAFHDGYFRTGDIAVRSQDGYYTLQGRMSDLIISGGFNIYPREIEDFLLEQPEVAEAAVIGVPDAAHGEIPVAYIVLSSELNPLELRSRCRAALSSFKVPRSFTVVDKLPRTALGKVQKHLLAKTVASPN
jgi:malonyl-CoA/methylmalonyl-CoA synthetase